MAIGAKVTAGFLLIILMGAGLGVWGYINETNGTAYLVFAIIILAAGVGVMFSVKSGLNKLMKTLINFKSFTASGADISQKLDERATGELGEAAKTYNKLAAKLTSMIEDISMLNERVSSSSDELHELSTETARNAVNQTEQIEQIVNSMVQMKETTADSAANAVIASESAKRASEFATRGKDVVDKTIKSMNSIKQRTEDSQRVVQALGEKSRQIGEIIQVINDIAEQTNLLALNAAIEAARAGEQGRGFAVVADEVRKLAEKTSTATKEISEMILTIQESTVSAVDSMNEASQEVSSGAEFINQAGTTLVEIVQTNDDVSEKITRIAAATEQQSATTEEISRTMEHISLLSNTVTSNAQRTASAAGELSDNIVKKMQDVLCQYKFSGKSMCIEDIGAKINSVPDLMSWHTSYSVGVKKYDDDHKELIHLINKLHAAMKLGLGTQILGDILGDLIEYTATHFKDEEQEMKRLGYPKQDSDAHIAQHHKFVQQALEVQQKFKEGRGGLTLDIMSFLKKWLAEHIVGTDKKYMSFFNSKGLK
ncbi:bacteriohemerythrin [Candidatus Magnetominusculus xianensis]|uniref:Methyl-accepting chemotaxis protein n=1 Tax=Candidatus Magnetominusculus xianensis TaxID=1748249 RepID=A0ABR5SJF8_9BACT|nr:bacteriohemerythrin [Candidatus Magnetominusculus xianensis]KWT92045.1 methyl-accepting chemotaxis protein [Candidatus Magnetominusculus xianensis]MBF0404625.1 bacteriohemerythrin [Nitrospirota bacterium]